MYNAKKQVEKAVSFARAESFVRQQVMRLNGWNENGHGIIVKQKTFYIPSGGHDTSDILDAS